jgi:zinc protease
MTKVFNKILVFTLFTVSIFAKENLSNNQPEINKLENGLSYYINKNTFHEKKAAFRLVVKAGSALETEEQRGIAHFVEHLVFRGSDNFKDMEVVKYLESIGAQFGADTNAYTSFDRTVYMLDVPLDNPKDLDKAILMLSDFAFRAHLKDEVIDEERNIILDELRLYLGSNTRVSEKHLKFFLKNTSYEDRLPIGKEEVIKNSSYENIRDFYNTWYKPENMAVIVVGDIDENVVKNSIETHFNIPKNEEFIEPKYIVNEKNYTDFSIVYDPEIAMSSIELIKIKKSDPITSSKDIKKYLENLILNGILNERFSDLSQSDNPSFMIAGTYNGRVLTSLEVNNYFAQCYKNKHLQALEAIMLEIQRIKKHKISLAEFKRTKIIIENDIEDNLINLDNLENETIIQDFIDNFIHDDILLSQVDLLNLEKKLLSDISFDEISLKCESFFDENYWTIAYTGPEDAKIDENQLLNTIEQAKKIDVEPLKEEISDNNFDAKISLYKLISSKKNENLNTLALEFENGLKVVFKQTNLKKDEIIISSFAKQGSAYLPKKLINSENIAIPYYYESGLGGIHPTKLDKFLRIKNSDISIGLGFNNRTISASTNNEAFEDILKIINRIFTTKNYRENAFNTLMTKEKEFSSEVSINPSYVFSNKIENILYNNNYLLSSKNLANVNFTEIQNIIDQFFTDPDGFTFYIVGDFNLDKAVDLVSKYLGGITSSANKIDLLKKLPSIAFNSKNEKNFIHVGLEDKSEARVIFKLNNQAMEKEKSWYNLNILTTLLNQKLLDILRQENHQSYGVRVNHSCLFVPSLDSFNLNITFSGSKENTSNMVDIVKKHIKSFLEYGASEDEIRTAKLIIKKDFDENIKYNNTWIDFLMNADKRNLDPNIFIDYEKILDDISKEDLLIFSQKLFSNFENTSFIWLPEN